MPRALTQRRTRRRRDRGPFVRRTSRPPQRHCGTRRWRSAAAPVLRYFHATAMSGGASSIIRRRRGYVGSCNAMYSTPAIRAAFSSAAACSGEHMRGARTEPPRRARPGRAARASRALPKYLTRSWNVRGPTLSVRMRRSQSSRSSSLSRRCPINVPPSALFVGSTTTEFISMQPQV